ncbi:MAG: sigma-54-dependent Fis family transcriptional regulator, partial [Planctomycetes bacterium]|nr:sigma-54-dependent Fis family transcriptional regulator [Planctomycetota bacterium]
NRSLQRRLDELVGAGEIIGGSPAIRRVLALVKQVAPSASTVLIQGESGTGKELVARELVRRGARAAGPFVAVNCAALPEGLMESEILGHEKGAFTGASERRAGRFEQADGGTLFLDEIGDMPLGLQAKLLRVLEDRVVERLGGGRPVQVDVRLVAATNQDLAAAVEDGKFREDLYYRLKVVDLYVPPLRSRREDIPLMVERFLSRYAAEHGRTVRGVAPAALGRLVAHDWPGNVRQLANLVERSVVLARGETIQEEDLPPEVLAPPAGASGPPGVGAAGASGGEPWGAQTLGLPLAEAKAHLLRRFETAYIEARLQEHRGNISAAARSMGVHRQSLQQKLRELGVHPNRYKD